MKVQIIQPNSGIYLAARQTIKNLTSGGNTLITATMLALIVANVPALNPLYNSLWEYEVTLQIGEFNLFSHHGQPMNIMQFINDALMAIFFFSIGLEIKREVLVGELSSIRKCMLSVLAAIGGMIVPVIIFSFLAKGSHYTGGAAIPMATDIAFSLGVLGLLGKRVPLSLKVFLTTLAVVDDIGGIIVIAIFYTETIEYTLLMYAAGFLLLLYLGMRMKIQSKTYYILLGIAVWFLFLNSGIHPTIAGVLVAFCIPAVPVSNPRKYIKEIRKSISQFPVEEDNTDQKVQYVLSKDQMDLLHRVQDAGSRVISPLQDLEESLHPLVNYIVLPLFAFSNAGIYIADMHLSDVYQGVSLAIICGLVIGKMLGIFLFSFIAIICRIAPMPHGSNWRMMASISMLGGIGFTVSLFIANLSFGTMGTDEGAELLRHSKLGILVGSVLSGILGYLLLKWSLPKGGAAVYDDAHEEDSLVTD